MTKPIHLESLKKSQEAISPAIGMTQLTTSPADPELIQQLQKNIRQLETASRVSEGTRVSSGCETIDQVLPGNGFARGTITEWIAGGKRRSGSGGTGADYLSLVAAEQACLDGGALVVIDSRREFYPPAASALGVNLANLIVLRPSPDSSAQKQQAEMLWAIDQSLRCQAVAAVWGPLEEIGERWFRRFQLSAESSGVMGLFVRPPAAISKPSWAEVSWIVRPAVSGDKSLRRINLQLHRCRGARTGTTVSIEINTVTGKIRKAICELRDHEREQRKPAKATNPLSLAAQLANPARRRRARRA